MRLTVCLSFRDSQSKKGPAFHHGPELTVLETKACILCPALSTSSYVHGTAALLWVLVSSKERKIQPPPGSLVRLKWNQAWRNAFWTISHHSDVKHFITGLIQQYWLSFSKEVAAESWTWLFRPKIQQFATLPVDIPSVPGPWYMMHALVLPSRHSCFINR